MRFSNYARIGKSPLIKAIGIQKNHIDTYYTESQELDRAASGCFSCPNYKNIEFLEYLPQETQMMPFSSVTIVVNVFIRPYIRNIFVI